MTAIGWIITIIDTDLTTPPIKYMEVGTNFDTLVLDALEYLHERIFHVSDQDDDYKSIKKEKELEAFDSEIRKLRDEGGYLMSIGGTICLDVRLMYAEMNLSSKRRGIELSEVEEKKTKRSRKTK